MSFRLHIYIWTIAVIGHSAHGQQADQTIVRSTPNHVVSTYRSDGAIFPATTQTSRRQRPKQVLISGSRQALPARSVWQTSFEPPSGGSYVAPASPSSETSRDFSPVVIVEPRLARRHGQQTLN